MSTKKKIKVGKVEFSNRLTIADVRTAKTEFDIDFGEMGEDSATVRMQLDPLVLVDVIWALYHKRLEQQKITSIEEFEAIFSDEDVEPVREAVVEAVSGFFPLIKTFYTAGRDILDGDPMELMAKGEELMAKRKEADNPSGMISSL